MSEAPDKRRESTRVEAVFRVRYATVDELVVGHTHNVSNGGIFLCTKRLLPLNAVIQIHLELPGDGGDVPVIGRVVFVRDARKAEATGKPAGMGVQFLDLVGERAETIERFIAEHGVVATEPSGPIRPTRRLHVLVVDDDPAYRDVAVTAFKARGDRVTTAADGLQALAACLKDAPDVVLSDVNMPRMDGWQLLRTIRSRPSLASVVVVFLTTLKSERDRLLGYQLGVDDYLPKPCRPDEVLVRVDRVVGRLAASRSSNSERKTLRGDLEQVSLPSVLSLLEMERRTGELLVVTDRTARLFVLEGRPIRIELAGAPPAAPAIERVMEVLGWTAGQFEFAAQDVSGDDEIGLSLSGLLLEHARRCDESTRG